MQEYFEVNDAAKALDLSASTVRILVERGTLRPTARTRRGVALFDPVEVERLRQQRERRQHESGR
jgi:DNA-binding transcriptional MerR regulator